MESARHTEPVTGPRSTGSRWIWPFELKEQIGEGGMGVVYRARYVVNDREVAVKMLPSDVTDRTALSRFEREMAVLKDLRHPNIVRCFGGACEDKRRFYAMELVEGGSLEDVLQRRGRLPWEQVIEYGLQMCAALECSHRHGVIHRDVKPGNFLIASNGQLKLSDFGLASVAAQRKITHPGKTAGTFLYMAPEQIRGAEVTPQTDLYALGCVLFELLTGRPPFTADTPAATLHKHCHEPAPQVSEFALDCPLTLNRLIAQLLEKDPTKRPQTAMEVARQLRSVNQAVVVTPRRPGSTIEDEADESTPASTPDTRPSLPKVAEIGRPGWPILAALAISFLVAVWAVQAWRTARHEASEWEDLWVRAASSSEQNVRAAALDALSRMVDRSGPAQEIVERALADPDANVRTSVVTGLGAGGSSGRNYLHELKNLQRSDPEEHVRMAAGVAIQQIESSPEEEGGNWVVYAGILVAAVAGYLMYRRVRV